jgi:hypothetical protein
MRFDDRYLGAPSYPDDALAEIVVQNIGCADNIGFGYFDAD